MTIKHNESGSGAAVLLLFALMLVGVGFVGYRVWQYKYSSGAASSPVASVKTPAAVPTTIKSKTDLNQASQALDANAADLNTLNGSNLNSDINTLL
jgi:hypothetical protein